MEIAVDAGEARRSAVHALKREWILEAARTVFARDGVTRASMREIAKHAGYTVGVLYHYFASKEELYAEVLSASLDSLVTALDAVPPGEPDAMFRALHDFYATRPVDFDLSFYLYQGARPVGLDDDLDRRLNGLVEQVMSLLGDALVDSGVATAGEAHSRAVALSAAVFGLVLMDHTGRLRTLGEDPAHLLDLLLADIRATSRKDVP